MFMFKKEGEVVDRSSCFFLFVFFIRKVNVLEIVFLAVFFLIRVWLFGYLIIEEVGKLCEWFV